MLPPRCTLRHPTGGLLRVATQLSPPVDAPPEAGNILPRLIHRPNHTACLEEPFHDDDQALRSGCTSGSPKMIPSGRRLVLAGALAAPFIPTARAEPVKMRVSLDTAPGHARTVSIADFLKKLEAASQGEIAPHLYDSGELLADHAVIKALVLGQIEMAAPGTWLVSAYVPEADLGQLPVFYGQPVSVTHAATDGIPGDLVNEQIARKLRVTIPGHWIDLGYFNWYSSRKPLASATPAASPSRGAPASSVPFQPRPTGPTCRPRWPRAFSTRCKAPMKAAPAPGCGTPGCATH